MNLGHSSQRSIASPHLGQDVVQYRPEDEEGIETDRLLSNDGDRPVSDFWD
jgi:hypothetical protein